MKITDISKTDSSPALRNFAIAFMAMVLLCVPGLAVSAQTVAATSGLPAGIGEVTWLLGKAWVNHGGGKRERIHQGMLLSSADVIETGSNAHVHVRFIDNALVSVRPSSRLEILRYEYRADAPAESAVKFNLQEGITRAISGDAAKSARGNFRLNTPIAAIGVRGTDFVVSAREQTVSALVNEGAIIVAAFSSSCFADALGPCNSTGVELTGETSQILQISASSGTPVLLPLPGSDIPDALMAVAGADNEPASVESESQDGNEKLAETVTVTAVNLKLADDSVTTITQTPLQPQPEPVPEPLPEFTPDVAIAEPELVNRQLVWGRFSESRTDNERITTSFLTAFENRKTTVANNQYALFRPEQDTQLVQRGLGVVDFSLDQAQAVFSNGNGSSLMDVQGGELSIDFNLNRYYTSLSLGHDITGDVGFSDSGRLYGGGYFHSDNVSAAESLAGAVSLDGAEAGYLFRKLIEAGSIEGLTLWSSAP